MHSEQTGHDIQAQIDAALLAKRFLPPIPASLAADYEAERDAGRRRFNWFAIASFAVIFDLFLLPQMKSAPELVPLSSMLRLGVMTPCMAMFILLDRRSRLAWLYEPLLVILALMPIVISAVLCVLTTSTSSLSDIRATPTILLSTGLIWRLRPPAAIANAVISCIILIGSVVLAPCVPTAELGSLILIDLSFVSTVITFALQLERRDRRVFLLQANERIRREALIASNIGLLQETQTDKLTGVANRRCFDDTLASVWHDAARTGRPVGLIMADVDHFKKFNDHYGHQGGDECLRMVALQGRDNVRSSDLFARYGGEEFAVILPNAHVDEAAAVAERIRGAVAALRLPHHGVGAEAVVGISLGVACVVPTDANGAQRLVEAADSNLYAAKRNGRNRVNTGRYEIANVADTADADTGAA